MTSCQFSENFSEYKPLLLSKPTESCFGTHLAKSAPAVDLTSPFETIIIPEFNTLRTY